MPEVRVATSTSHLYPDHTVTQIFVVCDVRARKRFKETRPTAACVKLGVTLKQREATADTCVRSNLRVVIISTGKRALSAALARDPKGLVSDQRTPLSGRLLGPFNRQNQTLQSRFTRCRHGIHAQRCGCRFQRCSGHPF